LFLKLLRGTAQKRKALKTDEFDWKSTDYLYRCSEVAESFSDTVARPVRAEVPQESGFLRPSERYNVQGIVIGVKNFVVFARLLPKT
jgi:hypothetical protein